MRLASKEKLKERLALSPTTNAMTSADSVLAAATPILANIIGTPFQDNDIQDWFSYRPSIYAGVFTGIKMYLTQGFVSDIIGVYYSADGNPVPTDVSALTAVVSSLYLTDKEKGSVTLLKEPPSGTASVLIEYSAGFVKEDDPEIPDWLSEAVISAAIPVMHAQSITHNKKDVVDMSVQMRTILYSQVNEHIRPRANGVFPCNTVVL